jgi:hypothetical protein
MPFVQTQEGSARRQVVVDDIENFSINTLLHPSQNNRISAVFDVGKRYGIGSAEVQK